MCASSAPCRATVCAALRADPTWKQPVAECPAPSPRRGADHLVCRPGRFCLRAFCACPRVRDI
eukprot:472488-Prymnesium_polylepis.1